ncbi:hypothetical protein N7492_003323 [Penicillium capsulatum]|uniref:Rad21/Rec8-like protein N-terminal domain-containing protein n=1 Tax=Penicillium capsulatum TaxID=69766 RepID=A0A9W9LW40_9EURO|nr:hypothetical protein N7492_003323 [Penicillium capsulatum]KAJ6122094.1 hypothetical protein N7512_004559 [Penicillium capsulatum]
MFYSHEILTSPEHGVATIWLVATLGSRSITRRFNRKAILDVDVPEACKVIISPEAPMALRLQGNLLYGVSRVYHEQCGYTLLDVQSMHDRMVSMLKIMPGGGLAPGAGKAKPSSLVIPYDPAFLPETGLLPGLPVSFPLLNGEVDSGADQYYLTWIKSPVDSLHSGSQMETPQIELPSDDGLRDLQDFNRDQNTSTRKHGLFGKPQTGLEEGVLLQPDFEFDADGNIVEFDASHLSPRKRRKLTEDLQPGDETTTDVIMEDPVITMPGEGLSTQANETVDAEIGRQEQDELAEGPPALAQDPDRMEIMESPQPRRAKRAARKIECDDQTTLRNTDLARWNNEYLTNMAQASKQKEQNKMQTIVKKNAAFWVFGQGLGSVGIGLGTLHAAHPLKIYSGEDFYDTLSGFINPNERASTHGNENSTGNKRQQDPPDVELGRQGPPSLIDEHSSQMPWNITASVQSSQRGRLGSMGDFSARGAQDSTGRLGSRPRNRITSASPLAGRGYRDGRERLDSLSIPGYPDEELDDLERMEITNYLEGELAADHEDFSALSRRASAARAISNLDTESLNFLEFIKTGMGASPDTNHILFSSLLPPNETTRTVATQGLMNVLTLATKGVLTVSQEPHHAGLPTNSWGTRYRYGEIHVRLSDQ